MFNQNIKRTWKVVGGLWLQSLVARHNLHFVFSFPLCHHFIISLPCLPRKSKFNLRLIFSIQGSLDLHKKISPPLKRPSASVDYGNFTEKSNGTVDLFGLLSIHDDKQGFSTAPPPSWTTFDCKMTILLSHIFIIILLFSFIPLILQQEFLENNRSY